MITINKKEQFVKIVAVSDNKKNEFIKDTAGAASLIAEDKTIYIVIKDKGCRIKQLKKGIKDALSTYTKNVSVDLDSFLTIFSEEKLVLVFNTIFETLGYVSHKVVTYKGLKDNKKTKEKEIEFNIVTKHDVKELERHAAIKVEQINYARDMQDLPPNFGTSEYYAEKIVKDTKGIAGLQVTVLGIPEAEKLGMGLFLGVNAGSKYEARVVVLEYIGDAKQPKTALVGKGICFDSGGYNLKPSNAMEGMKFDMSGAATVVSTVIGLAKAKSKANVVAIAMFTDNRIGYKATLPESVLTSMNGLTVEINNTDAEGRLVLADGITYAIREKKAERVIEISTLTGAMAFSLGSSATGAFTHSDELWKGLQAVSFETRERLWRMPMYEEHLERVKAAAVLGDLSNAVKGGEGSATAAAFLNEFAEEKPFIHFDIAGTAYENGRGNAVLIKTFYEFLK